MSRGSVEQLLYGAEEDDDEDTYTAANCRQLLLHLISISMLHTVQIQKEVRHLIQRLVNASLEINEFCYRISRMEYYVVKPNLSRFLKVTMPLLRMALFTHKMVIEGIKPPPPRAVGVKNVHGSFNFRNYSNIRIKTTPSKVSGSLPAPQANRDIGMDYVRPTFSAPELIVEPAPNCPHLSITFPWSRPAAGKAPPPSALLPELQTSAVTSDMGPLLPPPLPACIPPLSPPLVPQKSLTPHTLPFSIAPINISCNLPIRSPKPIAAYVAISKGNRLVHIDVEKPIREIKEPLRTIQSEEPTGAPEMDKRFVDMDALRAHVTWLCAERDLVEPCESVAELIAYACVQRLRNVVEKLIVITQHRTESWFKTDPQYVVAKDVASQIKFIDEVINLRQRRYEEMEQEETFCSSSSSTNGASDVEDGNCAKYQARESHRNKLDELRQEQTNSTALAMLGPRKKFTFETQYEVNSRTFKENTNAGQPSGRTKRIKMQDMIFYMENDPLWSRSHNLYMIYLK